jgi:hypothetical protein
MCATLALVAFQACADAPGPLPVEGQAVPVAPSAAPAVVAPPGTPPAASNVTVQRRNDGSRVITTTGDSTGMVNLLNRSMPNMRAREAAEFREREALRREREAEQAAALIHHTECYRLWGEATCAPKLNK